MMDNHRSTAVYFLRKIHSHNLQTGTLRFPRKFVGKYAENLLNPVFLKLPNGSQWKVKWKKRGNRMWLKNGWGKFAQDCSLAPGHRLLFRYEKSSHLHVRIFDKTALQIKYPQRRKLRKRKGRARDKNTINQDGAVRSNLTPKKCAETASGKEAQVADTEEISALLRASRFCSANPFFLVEMHRSYIRGFMMHLPSNFTTKYLSKREEYFILQVPEDFRTWHVKCYLKGKSQFVLSAGWKSFVEDNKLNVGDVCVFELINRSDMSFTVSIFRTGKESNCPQFQGTKSERICKYTRNSSACNSNIAEKCSRRGRKCQKLDAGESRLQKADQYKDEALNNSTALTTEKPSFKVVILPLHTHKNANLHIPSPFAEKYLNFEKKQGIVTLQLANGRVWYVEYKCRQGMNAELHSGWHKFVKDNDLKVGDVIMFVLIDNDRITLQVHILRGNKQLDCFTFPGQGNNANSSELLRRVKVEVESDAPHLGNGSENFQSRSKRCQQGKKAICASSALSKSEANKILEAIGDIVPENPFFNFCIRSSAMINNIPTDFILTHLKDDFRNVSLQVGTRLWPVTVIFYPKHSYGRFSAGWLSFARDVNLQVGDVCIFELIKIKEKVLKVSIVRLLD